MKPAGLYANIQAKTGIIRKAMGSK